MARKSRKNIVEIKENNLAKIYNTALYIRLSVEDSKKRGNSIETQKSILENFAALNTDIKVFDTYIDNGATGTNFERTQFKRMISDIESKKVNCVIVKDLSRLGRNSIDTGYYIEKYFPLNDVRFISVNDDFDTNNKDSYGIMLPIKNMINEAYSIDIGRKIKAQARQSMKNGEFIGGRAPYGYIKAPDNCHKLIIDEEAAKVVRQIFQWRYEGVSYNQIVKNLNEAKVMTPNRYAQSKGIINYKNLLGKEYWQTRTIQSILSRECYVGDMVQGKTQTINHNEIKVSEENWITVKNTHEPIISREMFEAVNNYNKKAADKYKVTAAKPYTPNVFKGKIFCGHCGRSLHRQRDCRHNIYSFHCLANERVAEKTCPSAYISEKTLFKIVIESIKEESGGFIGKKLELEKNDLSKSNKIQFESTVLEKKRELDKNRMFLKSLYESLINKIITDSEYSEMKQEYENKITNTLNEIKNLEDNQKRLKEKVEEYSNMEEHIPKIYGTTSLTAELIDKFIDKILVYSDKKAEIFFRFENIVKEVFYGE